MLSLSFLLDGVSEGIRDFDSFGEAGQVAVMGQVAGSIFLVVERRTPVDNTKRGRQKAIGEHMKNQWAITVEPDGKGATIGNPAKYAFVLEGGFYPNPGPRTVASGSGVFSRKAPHGIIKPLLDDPKAFDKAINTAMKTMKDQADRIFGKGAA